MGEPCYKTRGTHLAKKGLAVGIILLFLGSSVVTMMAPAEQQEPRTRYPYDCYHRSDTISTPLPANVENKIDDTPMTREASKSSDDGLMNSSWPMYCHDERHTGRSPYNTTVNPPGVMKWYFNTHEFGFYGSTIIDSDGTIYTASEDLYALYPNETLKWQFLTNGWSESCPAIDENGIIYLGTSLGNPNYFYAIYSNGTMKWRYPTGSNIYSSPAIGNDGIIYFGCGQSIVALNPNGTLRWQYPTDFYVYSSPAIGNDGTIFCGSHDTYLYALYPNNGTVKWMFKTDDWIRVSPCIADDGTIYCVSLDGYLYAVRPNGTMKWKTDVGAGTSPTIGRDGTIYAGWSKLYAVNPDGSVKWVFDSAGGIEGGTPCTSKEGIIYFGSSSGYCVAVNPDGTEAWRAPIGQCQSAPAIGEDGTIYIGSMYGDGRGYLNAFGQGPLKAEANGPYKVMINQPVQLTGTIFGGIPPYSCHWDLGDGNISEEQNPTHIYGNIGNFTVTFSVNDSEGNQSNDTSYVIVSAAAPSIAITKPENGIYLRDKKVLPFSRPFIIGAITIQVEASQEPFGIDRVEFYIDDTLKATDTETPYQYTWNTPAFFKHTIKVTAYDTSGKSTSKSLSVSKFF
jgi:outer membrane protein assembly factor BamB